ncbi:hypothetical protein [Sedimentibacter sp. zth1]|uniref:hypothetical protein n=1 Tax=Sedimentibacter sp. zth1 TaxID=2816908 RepID=UPI001F5ECBEF|nr:hypothetical protein [Sedimentibacter sp. zth1]
MLERILDRESIFLALKRVIPNIGSHGVDGMKTYELKEHLIQQAIAQELSKIYESIFSENSYGFEDIGTVWSDKV